MSLHTEIINAILHSANEPTELSGWLYHNEGTMEVPITHEPRPSPPRKRRKLQSLYRKLVVRGNERDVAWSREATR